MLSKGTLYIAQTGNVIYCVDILGRTGRMDQTIRCCFLVPNEREGIGTLRLLHDPPEVRRRPELLVVFIRDDKNLPSC